MIETKKCIDGLSYKATCTITGKSSFSTSEKKAIEYLEERLKQEKLLKEKYGDNWIKEFYERANKRYLELGIY